MLLGTDYPFEMGSMEPVEFVRSADLGDESTKAILGATAIGLLNL